jgi:hypothetical protein
VLTAVIQQLERCRTTVFYTGKGDTANAEFKNLAKVLGYEHKLDASRKGLSGFSSHHRSVGHSRLNSGDKLEKQQYAPDEPVLSDDDDEQARRLIAQESQSLAIPVNFQVRSELYLVAYAAAATSSDTCEHYCCWYHGSCMERW